MNKAILNQEVQEFIRMNLDFDLNKIILKGSPFPEVSIQEIAAQISGLLKARSKLPTWYETENIIFPPNINLEQASSEITAEYKTSLASGDRMIDITGGFGIDSFYLAEKSQKLIHCEINSELSAIAAHNFEQLGSTNMETFCGNGIEYLRSSSIHFDWLYIDPARRDDYGGKVFQLEHCTPNIPENLKLFFEKADHILIKTSPLLDLSAGIKDLNKVAEIHIVSVNNEVKELLWVLHKKILSKTLIKTINILSTEKQEFEAYLDGTVTEAPLALPGKFLYEPNPAIMKSGLFAEVAAQTGTAKLHNNSHLYTANTLKTFPGRSFEINKMLPYSKKLVKMEPSLRKANVTTRNFPKTVEEIRKDLKIADGGDQYLFFTTNRNNEKIVLVCSKVNTPFFL